ncbi:MAG: hypothetical protein ACTSPB_18560 [Candidatus Thorarchaeota archaeon]
MNEMRKLMEAVQVVNENDLYNFDKKDYIEALGFAYADEIIAEYGDAINTDDLDDLSAITDAYLRDELDDVRFAVDNAIQTRLNAGLGEAIEQINEVSDFDGDALDDLIDQFALTCEQLGISNNPVKKKELTQVVLARAKPLVTDIKDGPGGLGHENVLGNDHKPSYQNFPG